MSEFNVRQLSDSALRAYVVSHDFNDFTLKSLKDLAARLEIVGFSKYKLADRDELVAIVVAAAEDFLGRKLDEEDSVVCGTDVIGFVFPDHLKYVKAGHYSVLKIPRKGDAHGIYMGGILVGEEKYNICITDSSFVKEYQEQIRGQVTAQVCVNDKGELTAGAYIDSIPDSVVNLPTEEFVIKLRQHGIKDDGTIDEDVSLEADVKGVLISPVFGEGGKIVSIKPSWAMFKEQSNSPLYEDMKDGDSDYLYPVRFQKLEDMNNDDLYTMYVMYSRRVVKHHRADGSKKDSCFIFGDPKNERFYIASRAAWQKYFGQNLFDDDGLAWDKNPHKTWKATVGTPREFKTVGATRKTIKIRLVGEQYVKSDLDVRMGLVTDTENYLGYKIHDGVIHTNGIKVRYLSKRNVRMNRGWKWADCTVQIRTENTVALKGAMYGDKELYIAECKHHGLDPDGQDAIATMDIIKTQKHIWKPGMVIEIPLEDFYIIKLKMSNWSSSISTQGKRLHHQSCRSIYEETGALDRADLLKEAMLGGLDSVFDLLSYGGKEDSWEDNFTLRAKFGLFSQFDESQNEYMFCGWSSNRATLNARGRAFLRRNVQKTTCFNHGYYLQMDRRIFYIEEKRHEDNLKVAYDSIEDRGQTFDEWLKIAEAHAVPRVFYARLPKVAVFDDLLAEKYNINIGRNPMVGPGNLMGYDILAERNGSRDAVLISPRAAKAKYADQDGDTVTVVPSRAVKFPTYVAPADYKSVKSEEELPSVFNEEEYFENVVRKISHQVITSASDVGKLDLYTRRILYQRDWHWTNFVRAVKAGKMKLPVDQREKDMLIQKMKPVSADECILMGGICEGAIGGLKHSGQGAEEDSIAFLARTFGCYDMNSGTRLVYPLSKSPNEFLLTRSDVGKPDIKAFPAAQMEEFSRVLDRTEFHEFNPLNTTFERLRGMKLIVRHDDAVNMQTSAVAEWKSIIANYGKGKYKWYMKDVTSSAQRILTSYSAEANRIRRELNDDKDLRRKAYSALYNDHVKMIQDVVIQRFGSLNDPWAVCFQRHMMIYTANVTFGMDRRTRTRSQSGGAFWCYDMISCVCWLAERWNKPTTEEGGRRNPRHPANEYIPAIREACASAVFKREKREERRAAEYAAFADDLSENPYDS